MKAVILGLLAGVSMGFNAHAQSAVRSTNALDQATDQAQVTTPIDSHVDVDKGVFYDDGQERPASDYMFALPGRGGPGGGGGGGGMRPAPRPNPGQPGTRPGRPGRPDQPGTRPGRPGRPDQPGTRPGRPGRPDQPGRPGRPVPPRAGRDWGPGHHGGYGRGWHPGRGGYQHNPGYRDSYRWDRNHRPRWWYSGVQFPVWFWEYNVPQTYYQCIAFREGGYDAEPYLGFAPYLDEAAYNALEACGGSDICYIPPGYCQLR